MAERMFYQPPTHQEHFAKVPAMSIERSTFDRSHGLKSTFDAGFLVPVFVDEVIPGDTYHMKSTAFCRLATPLRPVMDNMYIDTHYWFVPYRLVWDNWQRFMGERIDPDDDPTVFTTPQTGFDLSQMAHDSLAAYMGMPYRSTVGQIEVSALPFRAYNLIWNEHYRDQNMQDPVPVPRDDGPEFIYGPCLRRGKRHDYFTSCLPWPQKGDPVLIPIAPRAPITGIGKELTTGFPDANVQVVETDGSTVTYPFSRSDAAGAPAMRFRADTTDGPPQIFAELSEATAITINDLRTAFQIQALLEADARGGTRYIEIIWNLFRVKSSDSRLQRPEFLGSGTSRISINPVAATFSGGTVAQGDLGGVGTGIGPGHFTKSFEEHGIVIGLVSVRADLTYQQGIERFWFKKTRYDHYLPLFANLGEQAVLNREIFVQDQPIDSEVFGYQERYAEYRYKPSRVSGMMMSEITGTLDVWHLAQDFSALPVLNASFIEDNPPIDRVIAVTTEPHFLLDMWFNLICERPMPTHGVPGFGPRY